MSDDFVTNVRGIVVGVALVAGLCGLVVLYSLGEAVVFILGGDN
jgi:hypothetical protein